MAGRKQMPKLTDYLFNATPIHNITVNRWSKVLYPESVRSCLNLLWLAEDEPLRITGRSAGLLADQLLSVMPCLNVDLDKRQVLLTQRPDDERLVIDGWSVEAALDLQGTSLVEMGRLPRGLDILVGSQVLSYVQSQNRIACNASGLYTTVAGMCMWATAHRIPIQFEA